MKHKKPLSLEEVVDQALGNLDGVTQGSMRERIFGISDEEPEMGGEVQEELVSSGEAPEEEVPEDLKAKLLALLAE